MALAAAVSPTVLTFAIFILSADYYPRARAGAFTVGFVAAVIVIGALAVGGSAAVAAPKHSSTFSAWLDIAIGLLLVAAGVRRFFAPPKPENKAKEEEVQAKPSSLSAKLVEAAGLGVFFAVTDVTSLVFYLAAAKQTADANLPEVEQIVAMSVVAFGFAAPIVLPLLTTFVAPATSQKFLHATNQALKKYGHLVMAPIALLFGVYLLYKGGLVLF